MPTTDVIQGISFVYKDKNAQAVVRRMLDAEGAGEKLQKRITSLKKKADFKTLTDSSKEYQEQLERLSKTGGQMTSRGKEMGSMMLVNAAAALQLARGIKDAAVAAGEFALEGAKAAAAAEQFAAIADHAAPRVQDLAAATASVVDDTTLQQYAVLAERAGLSAEQMLGLSRTITVAAARHGELANVGEILNNTLRGELEGLKKIGIFIDLSDKKYAGMTETVKKTRIAMDLSTGATQAQVDALDSLESQMLKTGAAAANAESDMAVMFAMLVETTGAAGKLTSAMEDLVVAFGGQTRAQKEATALGPLMIKTHAAEAIALENKISNINEAMNSTNVLSAAERKRFNERLTELKSERAAVRQLVRVRQDLIASREADAGARSERSTQDAVKAARIRADAEAVTAEAVARHDEKQKELTKSTRAHTSASHAAADANAILTQSFRDLVEVETNAWTTAGQLSSSMTTWWEQSAAVVGANQAQAESARLLADAWGATKTSMVAASKAAEESKITDVLQAAAAARTADLALEKKILGQRMAIGQTAIDSAAQVAGAVFKNEGAVYGLKAVGELAAMWASYPDPAGMIAHGTSAAIYTAAAAKAGSGGGASAGSSAGAASVGASQATVLSGANETAVAQDEGRQRTAPIFYFPNVVIDEREAGKIVTQYGNAYASDGGQGTLDSRLSGASQQGQPGF